jgi:integrase/recombinase XerD
MTRIDAVRMLKRRLVKVGIVGSYSPHSFRAIGLTRFLEEGGTLDIADHADSRTTKLYDRRQQIGAGGCGAHSVLTSNHVSSPAGRPR